MHKGDFDINLEDISKIEGHANLEIKVRENKVKYVKLKVTENKRFFVQAIRGKEAQSLPLLVSRICGTCSISHILCCIEALEKAIKIKPSEQTLMLRKLAMYGTMIRDHAMHLYLFSLPDVYDIDSLLDFAEQKHQFIHDCFDVKAVGNELSTFVAGRAIHPERMSIGGFTEIPDNNVDILIKNLKKIRKPVINLAEEFYKSKMKFERNTMFAALKTNDFSHLEGAISIDGKIIEEKDYLNHLNEVIIPYSQSTSFKLEKKEFMVGALARMNLNKENINKKTKKDMSKFMKKFPSINVYDNNLAQAIEMLHCIDHSIELLSNHELKEEKKMNIKFTESDGVGVVEAPRGTLYYGLNIKNGKIISGNIVIPTAQNQIKMENDLRILVENMIGNNKNDIAMECEKLIRAYDPCMSCASHFLKVKWI